MTSTELSRGCSCLVDPMDLPLILRSSTTYSTLRYTPICRSLLLQRWRGTANAPTRSSSRPEPSKRSFHVAPARHWMAARARRRACGSAGAVQKAGYITTVVPARCCPSRRAERPITESWGTPNQVQLKVCSCAGMLCELFSEDFLKRRARVAM